MTAIDWCADSSQWTRYLRDQGFGLTVGDDLRITTLSGRLKEAGLSLTDPAAAARWFGPVVCRSADDQNRLGKLLSAWADLRTGEEPRSWPHSDRVDAALRETARLNAGGQKLSPEREHETLPETTSRWTSWLSIRVIRVIAVIGIGLALLSLWVAFAPGPAIPNKAVSGNAVNFTVLGERVIIGAIVLAFFVLLVGIRRWQRRRKAAVLRGLVPRDAPATAVKITLDEFALFRPEAMRGAIADLRRHRLVAAASIDVSRSVAATVAAAGHVELVWASRPVLPEHLLLVDLASSEDILTVLAQLIVDRLRGGDAFVQRFDFCGDPRWLRQINESGSVEGAVDLETLRTTCPHHRLLVLSDAASFSEASSERLRGWVDKLRSWQDVALLTPLPGAQWGPRERALIRLGFNIVEATPKGMVELARQFRIDLPRDRATPGSASRSALDLRLSGDPYLWLGDRSPPVQRISALLVDLKATLGARGFLYLAGLAVFPAISPKLTLAFGRALADEHGDSLLTEQTLALLCRAPWLRHGRMPDWLRLALVHDLETRPDEAERVRATWSTLLEPQEEGAGTILPIDVVRQADRGLPNLVSELLQKSKSHREAILLLFLGRKKLPQLALELPEQLARMLRLGSGSATDRTLLVSGAILGSLVAAFVNLTSNPKDATSTTPPGGDLPGSAGVGDMPGLAGGGVEASVAYGACMIITICYLWGRFNTPRSNRSCTTQKKYWKGGLGYVLGGSLLFAVLSALLQAGELSPLIATLAVTSLLPNLSLLKRFDEWFRGICLDWAEIPAEVRRLAAGLTSESFNVTKEDVAELREAYGDGSYGATLADHLRHGNGEGLELSQIRFTRVVKLHHRIHKLAGELRYGSFFAEADRDWSELDRRTSEFLRRSAASLTVWERVFRTVDYSEAYEELMDARRQDCVQSCQEIFRALALFLARAVLRSEVSENNIADRLRHAGFAVSPVIHQRKFSINSLTALTALTSGAFLLLALANWFFVHVAAEPREWTSGIGSEAYPAFGLLIVVYAWGRFNTPPSNRYSTSQKLYWTSCAGYVLSALSLFVALAILLNSGPWRKILIPSGDDSLLVPLVATLAVTSLLPNLPLLKRSDEWFLAIFLHWAAIPAEMKRLAAGLTPESFSVTEEDVAELREAYDDGSYGDTLADHLRHGNGEGLELSQIRFTRVVKLHHRIHKLAGELRYGHFFVEFDKDWIELDRKTSDFLRRSAVSLTLAQRLRAVENAEAYEGLVEECRQHFAQSCQEIFRALALFLARAVLRSEVSENNIADRLRDIGFAAAEPINLPRFPINSLTGLALGVFLYLVLAIPFFGQVMGMSHQQTGLTNAAKVTLVRLLTVGVTVWLLQRYAFFRREPGEPLRFFAYVVNGSIAAVVAAGICLAFHLDDPNPLAASRGDLPLILLTFLLCTAVALCCDDWVEDKAPPVWWRLAEAAGCALVMTAGMAIVLTYLSDTLPFPIAALPAWKIALLISMPSVLVLVIGACVPHIYRSARRAATARRQEASALEAITIPADMGPPNTVSGAIVAPESNVFKRKGITRPVRPRVRSG